METKHTPTPWAIHAHYDNTDAHEPMAVVNEGGDSWTFQHTPIAHGNKIIGQLQFQSVARGFGAVTNINEHRANIAFVLRAVNHHDEMLALLKRIWQAREEHELVDMFGILLAHDIRDLLAKIEGK